MRIAATVRCLLNVDALARSAARRKRAARSRNARSFAASSSRAVLILAHPCNGLSSQWGGTSWESSSRLASDCAESDRISDSVCAKATGGGRAGAPVTVVASVSEVADSRLLTLASALSPGMYDSHGWTFPLFLRCWPRIKACCSTRALLTTQGTTLSRTRRRYATVSSTDAGCGPLTLACRACDARGDGESFCVGARGGVAHTAHNPHDVCRQVFPVELGQLELLQELEIGGLPVRLELSAQSQGDARREHCPRK
eukprot:scaffold11596_cov28-Tisochrysis_lutea.AAC.2